MGSSVTVGSMAREGGSPGLRITRSGPLTRLDQADHEAGPERVRVQTFAKTAAALGRAGPKTYGLKGLPLRSFCTKKGPPGECVEGTF